MVSTLRLSEQQETPIALVNSFIVRFNPTCYDQILHLLSHLDTFDRVSFYPIRVIHECDALGGIADIESHTDAVVLVGPSNSELNLVPILISMFFIALNDVTELTRPLVILHLLSVPRWIALFPSLFHIVLKLRRERLQVGYHLISLLSYLLLICEHVIRCDSVSDRHLHLFSDFLGRRLSFLSPSLLIFLRFLIILYLGEIARIHLLGDLFQLVLWILREHLGHKQLLEGLHLISVLEL